MGRECGVLEQWLGFDVEIALPRVAVLGSIWTAQLYCSSASTSFAVMGRGAYSLHAPLMVRLTTDYSVLGMSLSFSRRFPFDSQLVLSLAIFFLHRKPTNRAQDSVTCQYMLNIFLSFNCCLFERNFSRRIFNR
jgi:hypothetical protein